MTIWLRQIFSLKKRVPEEAYQLATTYQLGEPTKRYSTVSTNVLWILGGIAALLNGAFLIVHLGDPLIIFHACNRFKENYPSVFTPISALCTNNENKHESPEYIYIYLLGLFIIISFLICGSILIIRGIKDILRNSRTYEYSEGFVVIEDANKIIAVMRWNQIASLQQTNTISVAFRPINISPTYFAVDKNGMWQEIVYIDLKKRIERELAHGT